MRLHTLKPNDGAKKRRKRVGRGESSGTGKTSGKGHKGQKARSGGGVRLGFEGGQMPIYRRLPKKGFSNAQFKTLYAIINVSSLEERFSDGAEVNEETLRQVGLVKGKKWDGIKILGDGDLTKKLSVAVDHVTATARAKVEHAGGSISDLGAGEAVNRRRN